jgi:hypothetical protein
MRLVEKYVIVDADRICATADNSPDVARQDLPRAF